MYKYACLFLAALSSLDAGNVQKLHDYEVYYWRDFNGIVPTDAFPVGTYKNYENIYIVQVLHNDLLIPGRLDEDLNEAVYEYNARKWSTTKNIKIFCTNIPHFLKWHPTNSSTFEIDRTLIIGGYEPKNSVFIGRGVKNGDLLVGKVVFNKGTSTLLHTTQDNESVRLKNYEVLSFISIYLDGPSIKTLMTVYNNTVRDGYYWRDFKAIIPNDAYFTNFVHHEKLIYIVQVLYKDMLIPGMLEDGNVRAVFEYNTKQYFSEDNVKILCTYDSETLEWRKNDSSSFLTSKDNIIGGYEKDRTVFIGRGIKDDQFLVGKVIVDGKNTPLLHTTQDGKSVRLTSYEIFAHALPDDNTSAPSTVETTSSATIDLSESLNVDDSTEESPMILKTPKNVTLTTDSEVKRFIDQYLKNALKTYGLNIIEPSDDVRSVNASKNHRENDDGCKCDKRIYVININ